MSPNLHRFAPAGLLAAGTALVLVCVTFEWALRHVTRDVEESQHAEEITATLARLLQALTDVETGARGFAVSGVEAQLDVHDHGLAVQSTELANLHRLVVADSAQVTLLNTLEPVIEARLAEAARVVGLRRTQGERAAEDAIASGRGKQLLDEIRRRVEEMLTAERRRLQAQQAETSASFARTRSVVFVGTGAVAGLLLLTWDALRRGERERARLAAAEQAARGETASTQAQLATMLDSVSDAFVSLDDEFRSIHVNAKATQFFGGATLLGRDILKVFPAGTGEPFAQACRRALSEQCFVPQEKYYASSERWIEHRIYPSPTGLAVFFHDITERKQAERRLQAQNRILAMIAGGKELPATLDALLRFLEAESPDMLCSLLLIDPDGIHVRHGAAPSLPAEYARAIDGMAIGPSAGSCGTAAFRREPVFVHDIATDPLWTDYRALVLPLGLRACWSTPLFDAERRVVGTFAIYHREPGLPSGQHRELIAVATQLATVAITRERDGRELRESEARLRLATESSDTGLWDWDLRTNRVFFSAIWKRQIGWADHELPNDFEEWRQRVHPDDLAGALARVQALLAQPEGPFENEFRLRHRDGTYRWILARAAVRVDPAGRPARMLGSHLDITARKHAEARLQALAARLETIREEQNTHLAREVHDVLGQQLTALKLDLVLLRRRAALVGDTGLAAALGERITSTSALADDAIRSVQKIATELRPGTLDKLGLAAALGHESRAFAERASLICTCTTPTAPRALADKTAIAIFRIFQEALTNIARHARARHVGISLAHDPAQLTLEIADDGCGFSPAPPGSVLSLGLLGMSERARLIGGSLEIRSAPGTGTSLTLTVPTPP